MPVALTPRERARLKARAHPLEPVVHVGHAGLTDTVLAEIDRGLAAHELIKVRLGLDDRNERRALIDAIASRVDAAAVQAVGKVLVLYRPKPEEENPR